MASATAFSAIKTYLDAAFTSYPLVYENDAPFQPPEGTPWVMVEIYGNLFQQASYGSGDPATDKWREQGAVLCHVMTAVNTGSLLGRQIADSLAALFMGLRLPVSDIRFGDISIGTGEAQIDDGNWWAISARVEWVRDTI